MMEEITLDFERLQAFRQALIAQERSAATVEKYVRNARAFVRYAGGQKVNQAQLLSYKALLLETHTARSVNSMIAGINRYLSFCDSTLRMRPLRVQRQMFCPEEKELSRAEYVRLCRTAQRRNNMRLNLILQTICSTGIRVSELGFITVEAAKCGKAQVRCKGKTRVILIAQGLRQKLLRYAAQHGIAQGVLFVTRSGKPVSRTNIWREMKQLCSEAKVSPAKVFPHNLRHLFARVFYALEKDIAKLADVLGHSSIDTTRIYIISSGTEHLRRIENMHLIL